MSDLKQRLGLMARSRGFCGPAQNSAEGVVSSPHTLKDLDSEFRMKYGLRFSYLFLAAFLFFGLEGVFFDCFCIILSVSHKF